MLNLKESSLEHTDLFSLNKLVSLVSLDISYNANVQKEDFLEIIPKLQVFEIDCTPLATDIDFIGEMIEMGVEVRIHGKKYVNDEY